MNRRRHQPRSFSATMFGVILAALIVAAGGVYYVYLKNRQIQVRREIDEVERNISQYRFDIASTRADFDDETTWVSVMEWLKQNPSSLAPATVREDVKLDPKPRTGSVAQYPPQK